MCRGADAWLMQMETRRRGAEVQRCRGEEVQKCTRGAEVQMCRCAGDCAGDYVRAEQMQSKVQRSGVIGEAEQIQWCCWCRRGAASGAE